MHTISTFRKLGVFIDQNDTSIKIKSKGHLSLTEAKEPLYFGNSGTTARLLIGLLASLPLFSTIYGDPYLTERPMARVVNPLSRMGDRKSTRLNSSHVANSYAVFCLKQII